MSASVAQIAQLRRMTAESGVETYDDDAMADYIEAYPLLDAEGRAPDDDDWDATYDLHAAAADIWEEKAAAFAEEYDFSADGASYHLSQRYEQMMRQARFHRSRRSPRTATLVKWPEDTGASDTPWIVNQLDHDD
jgi:hypothetical protein